MEFAAAALSSIGSSITAAAPAALTNASAFGAAELAGGGTAAGFSAASAGSSIFASLGGMSTAASILSGGATVLSVLNAQRAGEMKAQALNAQADDADVSGQLEGLQGTDRRNSLKAQLTQAIGDRDVAAAASGVDLSFGTPAVARAQAQRDGERALAIDQDTQDFRVARLKERAAGYRAQAIGANAAGLGTAAALALQGGAQLARRG